MVLPGLQFEVERERQTVLGIRSDRAALIALFERGPVEQPTLIESPLQFLEVFGCPANGMLGPIAAQGYFDNGGRQLLVARFASMDARVATGTFPLGSFVEGVPLVSEQLVLETTNPGAFGNQISVRFRGRLRHRLMATSTFPSANFTVSGAAPDADSVGLRVRVWVEGVANWSRIAAIVGSVVALEDTFTLPAGPVDVVLEVFEREFSVEVREPGRATLVVSGLTLNDLPATNQRLASAGLAIAELTASGSALSLPAHLPILDRFSRLAGGSDGLDVPIDQTDLTMDALEKLGSSFRGALAALEASDVPNIVMAPDLYSRTFHSKGVRNLAFNLQHALLLADEMVRSAEKTRDRIVLLDPPLSEDLRPFGISELEAWRQDRVNALADARDFVGVYAPWVRVVEGPVFRGDDTMLIPPSAHVAGRMAATALNRGPWIATGNVALENVVGLSETLTVSAQERLQDVGINPLRESLPRGVTIQGVRSLSFPDRAPWRFLNKRQLFNYLRRALRPIGLSHVFESNDEATWIRLRRDITRLLQELFARGAFSGRVPEEAFFVKVDEELNPEQAHDNGVLTVQIAVAPSAPLEFLVVRLALSRSVVAVTEEPIV